MTQPKHAQNTDNGRYYRDPATGQQLPSITNVIDTAINKPMLVKWAAKVTAEHAVAYLPRWVKMARTDRDGLVKELKAQVPYVKETAADLGSRIHARVEAEVLGEPHESDDEVEPYARQAIDWFESWGVDFATDIEAAEATVLNRDLGYAGTGDLWVWLGYGPNRALWLVDYKTSATRPATSVYPEYALQLAALRNAPTLLLPDDTETPAPKVGGAAVLNLRQRKHAFIPLPADQDAFGAFTAALAVTRYLHALDLKPAPLDPPTTIPNRKGAA